MLRKSFMHREVVMASHAYAATVPCTARDPFFSNLPEVVPAGPGQGPACPGVPGTEMIDWLSDKSENISLAETGSGIDSVSHRPPFHPPPLHRSTLHRSTSCWKPRRPARLGPGPGPSWPPPAPPCHWLRTARQHQSLLSRRRLRGGCRRRRCLRDGSLRRRASLMGGSMRGT